MMTTKEFWKAVSHKKFSQVVKTLQDYKDQVNLEQGDPDSQGQNCLHKAASMGDTRILQALLDAGSKIDALDDFGLTAFMRAALNGRLDACKYLKQKGANMKVLGHKKQTALHEAAAHARTDVCLWLSQEAGFSKSEQDKYGRTPLDHAIRKEKKDCVKTLFEKDFPVNKETLPEYLYNPQD